MFISLKRVLKFGWQGFSRNKGLSFQVIFIIAVAVFVCTSLFFAKAIGQQALRLIQEKVDIAVSFKDTSSQEEIFQVREQLINSLSEEIENIDYISKEQALGNFREEHQNDQLWLFALEEVEGNPFLASLNIKVKTAQSYDQVAQVLEKSDFSALIDSISYDSAIKNKLAINRLFAIIANVKKSAIYLAIILGVLVLLITFNTIKFSISANKEEIATMRLVGAGNWFIRGPFLVQSGLYVLFAVIFVDLLFLIGLLFFNNQLADWFLGLDFLSYFRENLIVVILAQFFSALILSAFSTLLAARKYLKI